MLKGSAVFNRPFIEQQNKFRGLVSKFKSRRFVKDRATMPTVQFRSGLRELLLDTRVTLHSSQFDIFLTWVNHQIEGQLANFTHLAIGYDELSGVFTQAPVAPLERELLWITARIKADVTRLNAFRSGAECVEQLVFRGKIEDAIESLKLIERAFGITMWSVQLRIALEHQAGGLERQKRYTAEVRGVHKNGLLRFVAYHTSVRNEDRTTIAKYCDDIKVRIEKHQYYEPFVKTYARYRLAGEWPASESGLADILRVEQSHSSVDIYETFVAVVQEILRRDDLLESHRVLAKCLHNLTSVADFRLAKAALLLNEDKVYESLSQRSTEISDGLFSGNAKLAARTARRTLKAPGSIDPWQLVYAGFAFAHAARPRTKELHRPNDISLLIGRILNRRDIFGDSFVQLEKIVTNMRGLSAAAGLIDLLPLLRRSRPDAPWRPWLISMNSPAIGVEDLRPNYALSTQSIPFIGGCSAGMTELVWGRFHGIVCGHEDEGHAAITLFTAGYLLRKGEYQHAVDALDIQHIDERPELIRVMAVPMLLHAYFCLGDRQNVIALIADEAARGEANRRLIPVFSALGHYAWSDYKAVPTPILAPIALHLLWSTNESSVTASFLRFATGSFLRASGAILPSKLFELADLYPKHQLVFFLRAVCVPNILDASRVLKGSHKVMEERQAICAALRILDPANAEDYQDEVVAISNQMALDDGQWIVDRTRIYVDTDALSRWATKELSEDYARYRDLLVVDVGASQNFDDVLKELATVAQSQRSAFTPENEADAVLVSILSRIGEEFLNNPSFGFDYYLSKRIRHQSFIGLIRGPLEFANLITTRESESGGYHRNDFWLEKFACCNSGTKEALNEAFVKFAKKFDDTLRAAKDTSFHLHSQERPGGLLYLELTAQIITLARAIVRMDTTLQDFIGTTVALLWAALEPSLVKTRRFISDDLKTKIAEGFDELRATVRKLAEQDSAFLVFDVEIGGRSTEVQRALDDVAKWFSHADLEAHKRLFKLDQIVNISIDSALKCQRAFDPDICRQIEGDIEMPASSLVFVHDVLFVALDNVRAHSGLKKPQVKVEVQANIEDGTLMIEVLSESKAQNRTKQDEELRKIRQLIDVGNFAQHTRREGKSGFLKLAAVVQQSSKGRIDFGFTDASWFQLKVTYSMVVQTPNQPGDIYE